MRLFFRLLSFFAVFFSIHTLEAQRDTEFWFAAPEVSEINDPLYGQYDRPILLRITTAENPATITVSMPADPTFSPVVVTLAANLSTTIDLTSWINRIENVTPNIVQNKGILITSTADIFVYYEVMAQSCNCNPELFSLKGKNALGNEFVVPSQRTWAIDTIRFPGARAGFDIVAIENNTQVTITPSKPLLGGRSANQPFTITLNKGQTFSNQGLYRNGPNLLNGSLISASKLVAVTTKEDLLFTDGPCADLIGDQLVPTNIWGHEFVIGRGNLFQRDKVVVTASENGTEVYRDGNATPVGVFNKGQSFEFDLVNEVSTYIRTSKKASVFHYTGVNCEASAAVIPKLECTGSTSVSIFRSVSEYALLFIVTQNGNQNGFTVNGAAGVITAADFSPVPGTGGTYVFCKKNMNAGLPVGQASRIVNNLGKFQLGFLNGATPSLTTGCRYGYFSDFKAGNVQKSQLEVCRGDSIQLNAVGGISYQWSPAAGLSNANIANPKTSPEVNTEYKVIITTAGGCVDSAFVKVDVRKSMTDFVHESEVCNPLTVRFTATASTPASPEWVFGANPPVQQLNPQYTFPAPGNYSITFSVISEGCRDTVTKNIRLGLTDVNSLATTPDTTICTGAPTTLRAAGAMNYCWSPAQSLIGSQTSSNAVANGSGNTTYYVNGLVPGNNLLINADFNQGATGFTSQYNLSSTNTAVEQYVVANNTSSWNGSANCPDHTSGSGNMLIVNGGSLPGKTVWKQKIKISPQTNYVFGGWIQSHSTINPAQLQLWINNQPARQIQAASATCQWQQYYVTWNSGDLTDVEVAFAYNSTIGGNYFALDDIFFGTYQFLRDSVIVLTEKPQVTVVDPAAICEGQQAVLQATGAQSYTWSPTNGLDNINSANPNASPGTTTTYVVTGTTALGCKATDDVIVVVKSKPIVSITDDTIICRNSSVQLTATGGTQYQWTPPVDLQNANSPQPVASPVSDTKYVVLVTGQNGCQQKDSVMVRIQPEPVFTINNPKTICRLDTIQLSASGGDKYEWLTPANLSATTISNPKAFPAQTTTYSLRITESKCQVQTILNTAITVNPLPTVTANKANDLDCTTSQSQLMATGALNYNWSPSTGLSNPQSSQPVASPNQPMQYVVKGTDGNGCSATDTVFLDFQPINPSLNLMPNAFSPNGDGLNDCYRAQNWGVFQQIDFSIYNRWGQRIFHSKEASGCWDGRYKGVEQDGGVYVYLIRVQTACGDVERKGTFLLVR
jgi:gliding motility-associated-like protein